MKRVLIGYVTENIGNGIDKYLENVFSALIEEDISIDVLSCSYSDDLENKLDKKGIKLFKISRLTNPFKRYSQMKKICKLNNYDIIYFNISEAFNCICNIAARHYSKATIITHSHSAGNDNKNMLKRKLFYYLHTISKPILIKCTDKYYACSSIAGEWLFGKKILEEGKLRIINNTINTNRFKFNMKARIYVRTNFNISNEDIVLGFVGNFNYQKNIMFILKIFELIHQRNSHYKLMLIGDGELKNKMIEVITHANLQDNVLFVGRVNNVYDYMSAMDKFILASNFEGLGIVGIEAQVNGLPSFFSDGVPQEINISDLATFISLKEDIEIWVRTILQTNSKFDRNNVNLKDNLLIDKHEQINEFKDIFIKGKY